MKYPKILCTSFCLLSFTLAAKAQQFMHYIDSKPVMTIDYSEINGSPYLKPDWQPGNFTLANGFKSKEAIWLKFNMVTDKVTFKDEKVGAEMEFVVPVQEFTLSLAESDGAITRLFRSGYKDIEGTTPASFFEVISDGKTQLIKKTVKTLLETVVIGAPTKQRTFIEKSTKYYLVVDGKAQMVKNDKKSILAALADKQAALDTYLKANKINFKSEADLGKLIAYYNTL
jgi:hypothetical protein